MHPTVTRRTVLGGAAGIAALAWLPGRGAAAGAPPAVVGATPNTGLNALFTSYGNTGHGWTGADSTYSAPMPGGRVLWMFSDTILGPVNPDGTRPRSAPFINNSFMVQQGNRLTTVHGGTPADPEGLVEPPEHPDHWYWFGAGILTGGLLQQVIIEFERTGPGQWDWRWTSTALARFSVGRLSRPLDIRPLPSGAGVTWASWVEPVGPHTYIYGVEDLGLTKYMRVARVPGRNLLAPWQYFTGSGWSAREADSVRVMDGVSNEYSVTPFAGGYILVTQDTTELFSTKIVGYFANSPTGPFGGKTLLYTTPETGASGTYGNPNVFTYNPHVHPELSSGNRLLISYNVNTLDTDDLFEDVTIYRPRFIDVAFAP